MDEATAALTIMSLLIFAILLGFLIWGIKSKQFTNIEESKYKVFEKREEENPPPSKVADRKEDEIKC
jgi:nitrogen fixation-related uncharacterized protein